MGYLKRKIFKLDIQELTHMAFMRHIYIIWSRLSLYHSASAVDVSVYSDVDISTKMGQLRPS